MAESELVLAGLLFAAVLGTQRLDVARDHLLARNDLVLGLGSVFGGVLVDEVVVVVQQLELGLGDILGGVEILANGSLVLFDKGGDAVAAFVALGERRRCTGDRGLGVNADGKNECKETDVDKLHRDVTKRNIIVSELQPQTKYNTGVLFCRSCAIHIYKINFECYVPT